MKNKKKLTLPLPQGHVMWGKCKQTLDEFSPKFGDCMATQTVILILFVLQ